MSRHNMYYTGTYIPFPLKLKGDSGFTIADVVDLKVTITPVQSGCTSRTYTKSGGGIIENNGVLVLEVQPTDITVPGQYDMRVYLTTAATGNPRGLNNFPSRLIFK